MKRTRATINEVKHIEDWLRYKDESTCPFNVFSKFPPFQDKCKICYGYFPSLRKKVLEKKVKIKDETLYLCPCMIYEKSYVVRRAKQLVKEAYEKDKSNSQGS